MYTIDVYDGEHWQHVLYSDDRYTVESATLSESVNAASTLTFKVYEGHPSLSYLLAAIESPLPTSAQPTIMARRDGSTVFEGRIFQHVLDDLTGAHEFSCEGMLARLNDYTVSPYSYSGTVSGYLDMLLTECEGALWVGNVTVTDPNNYIVRSSEQPVMLWDEIANKCIGSPLGGYLEMRNGYIVDWLAQPSASTATQGMEAGINLTGLNVSVQPREMYSGVLAYGAEVGVTDSKGVPLYYNLAFLSASDVPSGYTLSGMTLFKDSLVDQIGQRVCIMRYESITQVSNLLARAQSFLNAQSTTPIIQVGAVDLADAGYNADAIECGAVVQITGATFDDSMMCTAISRDLLDPASTTFAFGAPDNISSSGSGSGAGGNSSISSPNFWHTSLDDTETDIGRTITGMSTQPLEDVITAVANRQNTVSGGAVWVNSGTFAQWDVYYGNLEARVNQLLARITDSRVSTSTSQLYMMGGSATLSASTSSNNASVNVNGNNGSVNVTGNLNVNSQTANTVLAAPNGSNGTATFRALDVADLPSAVQDKLATITSTPNEMQITSANGLRRLALTGANNVRVDTRASTSDAFETLYYAATAPITETTIANIITQSSTQSAANLVTAATYYKHGAVVMLQLTIKVLAARAAGDSISLGTIVSGKRPHLLACGGSDRFDGYINDETGACGFYVRTACTANSSYRVSFTYLIQ